jgi:hypothetical protein
MIRRLSWVLAATSILVTGRARAAEVGQEGDLASVEVHAFVSQGFILTSSNNYLADNTTHGSFQYSEIGINFTKPIVDKLRLGLQLFAQDLGPTGNYNAQVDWFYLDYHWQDWLAFRTGRVKIPFGLYNEINDVDAARVPVLLPQSVYPIANVNYLLAQTGAELYGYLGLGGAGAIEYRGYAGTILVDTLIPPGTPYQVTDLNVPYVVGGRLLWETPLQGLRVGGSLQALRIDATLVANAMPVSIRIPALLWVASAEYSVHNFVFSSEYSQWYLKSDSTDAALFPASPLITSERGYAMVTYRAAPWLQPGVYYSLLFPNASDRSGRANMQHDFATTVRFDLNSHWLVKLEGHYMSGTAGLTSSLNDNAPLSTLERNWGVFLVKTTAYF